MSVVIEHTIETDDVDELFDRLGDGRRARAELADVLDETSRLSAVSMSIYAPRGRTHKLARHISSRPASHSASGALEAAAGIEYMADEDDPKRGVYPDQGTGIFGSRQDVIRPKTSKFMSFEIGGQRIITKEVRGQEAQHFVRDAYADANEYLPPRLDLMVQRLTAARH